MPMVDVWNLEARVANCDTVIGANRIAHEQSRVGEVTGAAYKWCTAAGITEEELRDRHDEHQCYFCGEYVRNGGVIVHTFWHCPKRLEIHDKVQANFSSNLSGERSRGTQRDADSRQAVLRARTKTRTQRTGAAPRGSKEVAGGAEILSPPLMDRSGATTDAKTRVRPTTKRRPPPTPIGGPPRRIRDPPPRGGSRERCHPTGRTEPGASHEFARNRPQKDTNNTAPEGAALANARARRTKPTVNTIAPPKNIPERVYSSGSESDNEDMERPASAKTPSGNE